MQALPSASVFIVSTPSFSEALPAFSPAKSIPSAISMGSIVFSPSPAVTLSSPRLAVSVPFSSFIVTPQSSCGSVKPNFQQPGSLRVTSALAVLSPNFISA